MAKAEKTSKYKSQYAAACDYIESVGIDPVNVLVDGVTDTGYYDRSGHNKRWMNWPNREVGEKVLELMYGKQT